MEDKILRLFLCNNKLKFNEMEKSLKIRSNKLAYHLKKLIDRNLIEKNDGLYELTKSSEFLIPYISNKKSTLPIVLIHLGNNKECFLYRRVKRPFKNKLSLPGGRLLINESINKCVKRIMKDKHNLDVKLKKINSISIEHVKNNNKNIHSFLIIFVSVKNENNIRLTNITENKSKLISSDYKLLKNSLSNEIKIQKIITRI